MTILLAQCLDPVELFRACQQKLSVIVLARLQQIIRNPNGYSAGQMCVVVFNLFYEMSTERRVRVQLSCGCVLKWNIYVLAVL